MELKYTYSESTVEPSKIQVGKNFVYLRRNITEDKRTDDDGNVTVFYLYDEAKLTHDEFNEYSNFVAAKNAINGTDDSDNILYLMEGQENGDNNQLIIMEAIADLYDLIANMS